MLVFPGWNNTFIVQTDASSAGVGAVLLQAMKHEEQVLAFASRCFEKKTLVEVPRNRNAWLLYGGK